MKGATIDKRVREYGSNLTPPARSYDEIMASVPGRGTAIPQRTVVHEDKPIHETIRDAKKWLNDNYQKVVERSPYVLFGLELLSIGVGIIDKSHAYEWHNLAAGFGGGLVYSCILSADKKRRKPNT